MDTADTKFWICDSLLHLVHKIMANGHRDRRHEQWTNKIENLRLAAAVFHHLVSCVHKIVANGQQPNTHRAIDKNGSTISHKKPFNYFQIETSMMDFLILL